MNGADLERLTDLVSASSRIVAFTGAGVSTESGIPDFRSPGGIWDRFDPSEFTFQNFMASEGGRRRYWELGRTTFPVIRRAEPNPAHHALVSLWRLGKLDCVITQNIDDLHQRAGLPADHVIELHGNATRARCLTCERAWDRERVQEWLDAGVAVPLCDPPCGGIIKPRTVMFGEAMPRREMEEAERRARACDLFVVVGSSLVVYPAAYMPLHAKHAGATLVIVNLSDTPHDGQADLVIRGRALTMTAALVEHLLKGRLGHAAVSPVGELAPDLTLEQAYGLQRQLEQALVGRGERVVGYKVGFMLASGVFGSGDAVPLARFVAIGVEVEVAFLLKADLAGPGVTTASALLAVEGAMPSFELIDFRLSGTPRGVDVVADGVYSNAIVLGRPLTPMTGIDLALEGVVFEQDGQIVATQTAAEVLGNPLVSLAWAANRLGKMGRGLHAGDIVLTGSISKVLRPTAGQAVRASFTRLGSVGCRFA